MLILNIRFFAGLTVLRLYLSINAFGLSKMELRYANY